MVLPLRDTAWPLAGMQDISARYAELNAWRSGKHELLYANTATPAAGSKPFWRKKESKAGKPDTTDRTHMGTPAKITNVAVGMLLSEPVKITSAATEDAVKNAAQERLNLIAASYLNGVLKRGTASASALGGTFYKIAWDDSFKKNVFVEQVEADCVVPSWFHGELRSAQIWSTVHATAYEVWRYVEEHSTDSAGIGVIQHALFRGTVNNLGMEVPLTERPETSGIVPMLDANNTISTRTPGLGIVYASNVSSSVHWRDHPIGKWLGRSDYEGCEPKFHKIDETASSMFHDMSSGRARAFIDESLVKSSGPGKGGEVEIEDYMVVLKSGGVPGSREKQTGLPIESMQFDIRADAHLLILSFLEKATASSAGFSPGSFGMEDGAKAATATETNSRNQASKQKRGEKEQNLTHALKYILEKAMATDAVLFNTGVKEFGVIIVFADPWAADQAAIAEQNTADAASGSASTFTRVKRLNPDWDDVAIQKEVDLILAEKKALLPAVQAPAAL